MSSNQIHKVIYFLLFFALTFIYIYISISLPHHFFRDRDVYFVYASNSQELYEFYDGMVVYFNEPLFLKINILLNNFFTPSNVVYFFLFFCLFGILILLYKYSKNIFMFFGGLVFIVVCNYAFHAQFVVLRQTIATVILLYALTYLKDIKMIILISLLCSFIHVSFFLITALLIFYEMIGRFSTNIKSFVIVLSSAVMGLFITVAGKYLGIRQATEDHIISGVNVGGGAFLCFSIILLYFLFLFKVNENTRRIYDFCILGLSIFIGLYFINPAAGRLMSTFIFPIIFLLCSKFNIINSLFLSLILVVFIYLDMQGAITGMSLNVSFSEIIRYIQMSLIP
ncbi:EpsG family protein [Acinetobacter sp. 1239920]|nr:EpsG family protein [Acinetobacter sp. 1239920]EXE57087.1 putative membrane protein [Acinetobacter sp. 1239920]